METIIIGKQEWSTTNISEILFSNGDLIPVAYDLNEWLNYFESGKPCCLLDEWSGSSHPFYYYNGFAAADPRGIGKNGFRIPTQADFLELTSNLDMVNGCPELRLPNGWQKMFDMPGNNSLGFNAEFVGHVDFAFDKSQSFLWTSDQTEFEDGDETIIASVYFTFSNFWYDSNRLGLPIRLVRDL